MNETSHAGEQGAKTTGWSQVVGSFCLEFVVLVLLGAVVSGCVYLLHDVAVLQAIDRAMGDRLMRDAAREALASDKELGPRAMFVSVGERSCTKWAEAMNAGCTVAFSMPRPKLAKLIQRVAKEKPRAVLIDFDLPPGPDPSADKTVCEAVRVLSRSAVVVVPLPLERGPGDIFKAAPSLLENCAEPGRLLFASPVLLPDADGIVRQVQTWTHLGGRVVPGIGFVLAVLASETASVEAACALWAAECEHTITLGRIPYDPAASKKRYDRIQFVLPWGEGVPLEPSLGNSPGRLGTIEAIDLLATPEPAGRLDGTMVFIGASHPASGDLHPTPLALDMPGAIVHANAMVAYAGGRVLREGTNWVTKGAIIGMVAFVGALVHVVSVFLPRMKFSGAVVLAPLLAVVCVVGNVWIALWYAPMRAAEDLVQGGAVVGAVTPALAVAFEGLVEVVHNLKTLFHACFAWLGRGTSRIWAELLQRVGWTRGSAGP